MSIGERDPHTGVRTTGHEWSGIKELDNPIPRVVKLSYAVTFLISLLLWILYPAWPWLNTFSPGVLGWSQQGVLETQLTDAARQSAHWTDQIAAMDVSEIVKDRALNAFALQRGETLFGDNCSVCHGQTGHGAPGFPNLTDRAWLWGGELEQIRETISVGINTDHEDTRTSEMLAFGQDDILGRSEINAVVSYVRNLSGLEISDDAIIERGRVIFMEHCESCHGKTADGNADLGAPDLTDATWIYGGERQSVYNTVFNGRMGQMPHWSARLTPAQIKMLTVYVANLRQP